MQDYNYTLDAEGAILADIVSLNNIVRPLIINVAVSKNMDGSIPTDNVTITANKVLVSSEENELAAIINGYATHELIARTAIEHDTMTPAMAYGMAFLAKFSANNIYRGKTAVQVGTLLATYPDLIHAAITGSLQALYYTITTMSADANISQEEIDEFKLRLEIYLGLV